MIWLASIVGIIITIVGGIRLVVELIEWYNNRNNTIKNEMEYSLKSLKDLPPEALFYTSVDVVSEGLTKAPELSEGGPSVTPQQSTDLDIKSIYQNSDAT